MSCTLGRHAHVVHVDMTGGFAWLCLACEKQVGGRPMDPDAIAGLTEFLKDASTNLAKPPKGKGADEMKLEMAMMAGPESKAFLVGLTEQIDRLEKLVGQVGERSAMDKPSEEDDAEELAPRKKPAAKASAFDDEEEFEDKEEKAPAKKTAKPSFDDEEEDEDTTMSRADRIAMSEANLQRLKKEEEAPKKAQKAKAPKAPTIDDVNDACKAYAQEHGVKATKAFLLKKFKTESVREIPAEKYGDAIKTLAV